MQATGTHVTTRRLKQCGTASVNELSGETEPVSSGSVAYTAPLVLLPTCMQQRFADCCVETIIVGAALSVGVHDGTAHAM